MPEVGPRIANAGGATAGFGNPAGGGPVPGVLDVDAPAAGEEVAVARVAGRQDTVEHVDALGDGFEDVLGGADTHQVMRPVLGELRRDVMNHRIHHLFV